MNSLVIAGGSGGHLIPALTLAEHLTRFGSCSVVSTAWPVDRIVAKQSSLEWITVNLQRLTPLVRWFSPSYTVRQWNAVREIRFILQRFDPDVVIGFGGYVSAVAITAARLRGIPSVIHEQNFLPGRANRWLSPLVNAVALTFPETKKYLSSRALIEVTGNPIRIDPRETSFEEARAFFGFDLVRPVLLIMGGSQGACAINRLMMSIWENQFVEERARIQILHLSGAAEASALERDYRRLGMEARVFPFLWQMPQAYRAATLAISRAGATTISELVATQSPSILIPYPYAGAHQLANARWLASIGGALVFEEGQLTSEFCGRQIFSLLSDSRRLESMRHQLASRTNGAAVEKLGLLVRKVAR